MRTRTPSSARIHLLNALPNVLWTTLAISPVYLFCTRHVPVRELYLFGGASLVFAMLPKSMLRRMQLSRDAALYRTLRVPWLTRLARDSGWMRRLAGVAPSPVPRDRAVLAQRIGNTWARERFHWAVLLFFLLCAAAALLQRRFAWCALLMLLNLGYNLYPIWLQQFLRMRFERLLR